MCTCMYRSLWRSEEGILANLFTTVKRYNGIGKGLFGLTVSESESMTIVTGARQQAGRHATGAVATSLHLDLQAWGRESHLGILWAFETCNPPQWHASLNKITSNTPQTVSLTGNQVPTSSLKPLQRVSDPLELALQASIAHGCWDLNSSSQDKATPT